MRGEIFAYLLFSQNKPQRKELPQMRLLPMQMQLAILLKSLTKNLTLSFLEIRNHYQKQINQ